MTMTPPYNDYYAVLKVDPKDATIWFFEHRYITLDHCQSVLAETVPSVQALKLLTIVSNVDGGQLALTSFAKERNYKVANSVPLPAGGKNDHPWNHFREMLKRWTRVECENIRHVWQQALDVLKLEEAYVHLTMLDVCGAKSKEVKPNDYSYLLGDETRIIIDADPGMGKTTYVSKLACDWATGSEPQLQYFDQIFLVTLRYISNDDLAVAIANLTGFDEYLQLVRQCITDMNIITKTLVILDGYDELHASQFPKIINAINCETFKHVKMLVTTRRSHAEKIKKKPMWLRINGFKEKEQKTFVEIQLGASSSSMEQVVSLAPSFKQHLDAPLFLAITCAVVKSGETGIVETKSSLSGPSGLLNLMGAYHEILFKRAKRLKRCYCVDGVTNFQRLLAAVGWHAARKVFPDAEWVWNLHGYYESIIKDLNFVNADDVLTAAKEMCLVWHRQRQMYPLFTHKTDEFLFLHKIFEEYLSAVFLAGAVNQNKELLSSIPELQATSPVSYFLSGMSNAYICIRLQQAFRKQVFHSFSKKYCKIPWVADLPASLKDVAQPAACLSLSEVAIKGADMKLTSHVASQLPGFLIQARALLKVTLANMEIDSDISPLFYSTIKELELENIIFTGEPFAALQSTLSKQAKIEAGRISFNEMGVDVACKVNIKQLVMKELSIYFDISCIFHTTIKHLKFFDIEISQRSSDIMKKNPPARADCKTLKIEHLSCDRDHSLLAMERMKHLKGDFRYKANEQNVLRLLFSNRFPSLKDLTLQCASIESSRLAAFLVQCEQIGGIQCLSLTDINEADETVRPNLFNGGNQLTRLRALETLELNGVSTTCADTLFQLAVDCIKSVDVCLYEMDHEQDALRPLFSYRFHCLKELTLRSASIEPSRLAAFLVQCEQIGGIQCLSLTDINEADETVRPNLFNGGNQLTRLRALETLELDGVSRTCADTLFQLAVDCIKSVDVDLLDMDDEQDVLRSLFSYRFHCLKELTLRSASIEPSRLAAFLVQCEQIGGIQCLSLTNIKSAGEAVRPNLFNGGNQLTRLRALETLELIGVSTTCADTLFQLAVDCIKSVYARLHKMGHEQEVLRPLFSYRFSSLKDLTLSYGNIEASGLAAFLVQCEQIGGIQCLSLTNIKSADEAVRPNLFNGGNQLTRLRALETLKLDGVSSTCADTLFQLAVDNIKSLDVSLYKMGHEQDFLRSLFSYRFSSLKDLTLSYGNIEASGLAAFLVQCEQTGGIQCLSLTNFKSADEAVRPNLFNGGNQLTRLRALETLKLDGVSRTCADTLFQLAVDCIKSVHVNLFNIDHEQDVLGLLFSYRFHCLKELTLRSASIEPSRLAAFLVQCEQTGGIQCLSLIDINDAADAARLKLTQLPRLRALETFKLNDVGSDCAHVLFALAVDSMRCLEVDFDCFKDLQDTISGVNHLDTLCIECYRDVGNLTSCNFCPARRIVIKYFSIRCCFDSCWAAKETDVLKNTILFLLNLRKFTGVEITAGVRQACDYITDLQGSWLPHIYKVVPRVDSDLITFAYSNMCTNAGISADKGNDGDDSLDTTIHAQ